MTRDQSMRLIALCGQALYGDQWQSQLARALGVHVRAAQRWASGDRVPREEMWARIRELLAENAHEIEACMLELETGVAVE